MAAADVLLAQLERYDDLPRDVAALHEHLHPADPSWVDGQGSSHEKVFDVAWSGERTPDTDGTLAAVGNTVDVASATYTNSIGTEQLSVVWTDPEFDPSREAFYYARAIEIPTPRWSTYDARALGVEAPAPVSIQERAISSAIWYRGE